MSTLAVERVKLFSTRSPWWSMLLVTVIPLGFGALVTATAKAQDMKLAYAMAGIQFAMMVIMVMAAIAVTTEYRFGTIRTTFQALPNRAGVLWTKAALLGGVSLLLGEVVAFATFGLARLLAKPGMPITLSTAADWRNVAGAGAIYAIAAVIAVGVGAIVRQTAGAIAILMIWPLVVENLIGIVPGVGAAISRYLPFNNATAFLGGAETSGIADPLPALASIGIFAGTALAIMTVATVLVRRRDA